MFVPLSFFPNGNTMFLVSTKHCLFAQQVTSSDGILLWIHFVVFMSHDYNLGTFEITNYLWHVPIIVSFLTFLIVNTWPNQNTNKYKILTRTLKNLFQSSFNSFRSFVFLCNFRTSCLCSFLLIFLLPLADSLFSVTEAGVWIHLLQQCQTRPGLVIYCLEESNCEHMLSIGRQPPKKERVKRTPKIKPQNKMNQACFLLTTVTTRAERIESCSKKNRRENGPQLCMLFYHFFPSE